MKSIVSNRTRRLNEQGFTFLEVLYQLVVLTLLITMLPFILAQADQWRHTEGFHEEVEWEYVVNEMLKLVQQYDYFEPYILNDLRISLYREETIQNYDGPTFPKADALLTVANGSIILSKNNGTEPIIYSNMTFSFQQLSNGFILKRINEDGEVKHRQFYMRKLKNE